jgi:hypothetical protein
MSDIKVYAAVATFLPPCRGKVRMGVKIESEQWNINASTPFLALPLQGGGDESGCIGQYLARLSS